MVREVARIDFELRPDESAALAHEAKLLRRLKPKFNRAGVWPSKVQFLTWRFADHAAHFALGEIPPVGWERYGSLAAIRSRLHGTLVRLLWLALNPHAGFSGLPYGWAHHRFALPVTIALGQRENRSPADAGAAILGTTGGMCGVVENLHRSQTARL